MEQLLAVGGPTQSVSSEIFWCQKEVLDIVNLTHQYAVAKVCLFVNGENAIPSLFLSFIFL